MRHIRIWTWSLLFLCFTASAWADGDTRPATKAEKDYSLRVLKELSQALPKPLPGFEVQEATPLVPFNRVTPGCEAEPLRVYYSVTWVNRAQQAKESAREHEALSRAAAKIDTASMRAQQKAFMERQSKLAAEFGKAIEKRDQAKAEKIQKEMEKLAQEVEKMGQSQNAVVQNETKSLTKLSLLKIRMSVNKFHESQLAHSLKELQPIAGNPAYAHHDKEGKFEDYMVVLVGPWKKKIVNQQVVYEASKASLPHTRAQTVIVRVNGDPSLTGQALRAINWRALQALIK